VRDIDACEINDKELLISSCSQDNYIRLWKIKSQILTNNQNENTTTTTLIGDDLKLKKSVFRVFSSEHNCDVEYSVRLESVLLGHEDWIYATKFHPRIQDINDNERTTQPSCLLSASMDKTVVIWNYDSENNIWIDTNRVGEIGDNTLGFYGAIWSPKGDNFIAHGYQGALNAWSFNINNISANIEPAVINSGHFDLVEDICWEPDNKFLVSVSKDQTARFHGKWYPKRNNTNEIRSSISTWHEFGRPQIHGYDLTCLAFINRFKFVSGADEKLLRIFEAPKIVLKNYYNLSGDESVIELLNVSSSLPEGASVPALGLSNKAVYDDNQHEQTKQQQDQKYSGLTDDLYKDVYFNVVDLTKPPTEGHLLQNTLWPEVQKLYGHGYELFTVAVDPKQKIIASACKASNSEHATIILWQEQMCNDQLSYRQANVLTAHDLTIVQLKFSNDGNYLLSVSRDRSLKLFHRSDKDGGVVDFKLIKSINTKNPYHTRIIWSCDWSHDDKYFVTTSRDKRACIWSVDSSVNTTNFTPIKQKSDKFYLELDDSITACSFGPNLINNNCYLSAFGVERGGIHLFNWNPTTQSFNKLTTIDTKYSHHLTVKRLSFRKTKEDENNNENKFELASCSDDCSVRIFEIEF
jgi:elongator complex protein 2